MSFRPRVIRSTAAWRTVSVVALAAAALVVLLTWLGSAQQTQITRTWDGGGADSSWSTASNWSADDAPDGTGEAALFADDPAGQTKLAPTLSANVTIGQLQFSATAPSYTITGSGAPILYISPAASYGGVGLTVASGAANQTISPEVFLLSTQTWDIGGTTTLTASGTIEDDSVIDYGLTKNGTGTLVFPGDVRYDGPTTVNAGSLVLSFSNTSMLSALTVNAGLLRATTSANALGNSSTRNTITLAGGALELANNTGLTFGSTSRITTVTGNSTIRSGRLTAGTGVTHRLGTLRIGAQTLSVTAGTNVTSGTAGTTFGATTLLGNATFDVVNGAGANAQLTLGAVGQSGGTRSVTKTGSGTLLLNGAGSYTGGTTLDQGALTLGVTNALGSGGFNFAGGTLNANNRTDSSIGALTLTDNSTLQLSPGGAAATLTFSGASGTAGGILTITGWSGSAGGLGTNDKILFSGGTTPSADFLQHIRFDLGDGKTYVGALGAGGELFPIAASGSPVAVPGVALLTQANAASTIVAAGLTLGTVSHAPSSTVPAGSVLSQSPAPGTFVPPGTRVDLVVSSGPDEHVAGTTGAMDVVALPPNLNGGQFISQTHIRLMHEGTGMVTAGMPGFQADGARHDPALGVGQPADATFANAIVTPYGGPGLPAVGTAVHSILLHFDPNVSGLPFDLSQGVAQSATITFDRPIIGAYVTSDALDVTDSVFGLGTIYPTGNTGRDMEFNYDGDSFAISADRLTLSLTMFSHNGGVLDEMRVILAAVTVPSVTNTLLAAAQSVLVAAGLQSGVITTAYSNTVPAGYVISQNPSAGAGVPLGSSINLVVSLGAAPSNTPPTVVLTAPADHATGLGVSVMLTASVTDADATTVTFYGRKTAPAVPGPDFVIATLPDTQYYSQNTGGTLATTFFQQTQWYADSRGALNLAFVSHMGDVVQSGDNGSNNSEWNVADTAMRFIEDPARTGLPDGIPWGGAPGNHDQTTVGQVNAPNAKWNQFFGANRWTGRPYFGGSFSPTNNSNNYELFEAGGLGFLIIHLDYTTAAGVNQAVLDWADGLMKANPGRRAIVTSHWILDLPPTSPIGAPAPFGGPGQRFFDEFKDNPNFFLMLSGHQHGEGRRADVFDGRTIYTVLQDYQGRANGGDGWLRYFVFSPANNTITAKTYSPTLDQFESDTDATSAPRNQASEFVLPYDMQSAVAPWTALGTVNVAAGGGSAQFNWMGLEEGSTYEWYVGASDGMATTTSTVRSFSTADSMAPTVTLTSPANNAVFTTPANITLTATAGDSAGTVTKVEFFAGATKLGEDSTSPFSFTWTNAPAGSYSLTARATDDENTTTTSTAVAIAVNAWLNVPPTVTLTAPANNATFTAPASVTLTATAADPDGSVTRVEFFDGTTKLGEDTTSPYSYTWSSAGGGGHVLSAVATDNVGATTTSPSVAITVNPPSNVPPTVTLTAPASNAVFTTPASVTLTATAGDSDGTVSKVEFFQGATKLGEDASSPYSYTWNSVPAGSYNLTARATDNSNATTTSTAVTIIVNTPPSVALTAPANGATFATPGTITLTANASDTDGTVTLVEFYSGATKLGEDATSPYSYTWTNPAAGSPALTARATDNRGATTVSSPVTIQIAGTTPAGPVAAYDFDDGAGTVLTDVTGRGHPGTISGATWTSSGHSGSALTFSGSARVIVGDANDLDLTTAMTLEAWVYPTQVPTDWTTVILKENSPGLAYALYGGTAANRPEGYVSIASDRGVTGTAAVPQNTWTHLAATYDGVILRLFVNGVQGASQGVTGAIRTSSGALSIGGNGVWGEYFRGRLDDVRIYNRALSAAEVQADMNTPVGR